jgi:hypothetical protein
VLAGAGVAAAAAAVVIAVVLLDSEPSGPAAGFAFTDDFSSNADRWTSDPGGGGSVEDGTFRVAWERAEDRWGVMASPSLSTTAPPNLSLEVDARRSGGDATDAWGYGLFCRANGPDNLYGFVVRGFQTRVEKRADGKYSYPEHANVATVRSPADRESQKLRATCVDQGDDAVELSFWVDDELIGRWTDSEDPHRDGSFGLLTTLATKEGELGDILEVEFDDFSVSEEPSGGR